VGKRAVYPGMFDPMHNGHLDLIERSLRVFDELIVAVVANPSKAPLFTVKERLELIDECTAGMDRMRITSFDGLTIDLVEREQADCIVRGLRAVSDFEYEFQMALMNRKLAAEVETIFLMPKEDYTYLSSRIVKEIARLGGDVAAFVPGPVKEALMQKFAGQMREP
jgi:pantetheine-phosphate adenylyltransferase